MNSDPLRILIVDDSRIFRSALENALKEHPGVRVVGSVWSGEKAVEFVRDSPPDLVSLDLNMPGRNGLDTLSDIRELNASRPDRPPVGVLLVSALTDQGAAITVEGLARGAFDFIHKPEGPDDRANALALQRQLFEKIELFEKRRMRWGRVAALPRKPIATRAPVRLGQYRAVAIGSSTGGPEALAYLLPQLTTRTSVPLFIVQHFGTGSMTRYFADNLGKKCAYRVVEATDGETVEPHTAYIAPGGRHMVLRKQGSRVRTALNDLPPENNCRPSVDVLFRSVAEVYPRSAIALILTGMGSDGTKGLGPLKRGGAYVIAQDEATSVVWGMPRAAAATGLVDEVLPLECIGSKVASLLEAGTSPCN